MRRDKERGEGGREYEQTRREERGEGGLKRQGVGRPVREVNMVHQEKFRKNWDSPKHQKIL